MEIQLAASIILIMSAITGLGFMAYFSYKFIQRVNEYEQDRRSFDDFVSSRERVGMDADAR